MGSLIGRAGRQFGSDVYTHYTAVYTWKANQMAHAMMGFAGTTLFIHVATRLGMEFWYGAAFYFIPFLKDLTDIAVDLSLSVRQFPKTPAFRREVILDAVTDNLFWSTGLMLALFLAAISLEDRSWWLCSVLLVVIFLHILAIRGVSRHFISQKLQFDRSGLPYYFRLPLYAGRLAANPNSASPAEVPVKEVEKFVFLDNQRASHLVLYGPQRSFKTTLAAAIGSGLTTRRQSVRYLSKTRLVEAFAAPHFPACRAGSLPVHPHGADIVIIDDLDQPSGLPMILPALAGKSTVWVISSTSTTSVNCWMNILSIGLKHRLTLIKLEPSNQEDGGPSRVVEVLALITLAISVISVVSAVAVIICL